MLESSSIICVYFSSTYLDRKSITYDYSFEIYEQLSGEIEMDTCFCYLKMGLFY